MNLSSLPPLIPEPTASPRPQPGGAAGAGGADFQSFLTLLTAQLRNQDPLQPLDSTQFVAQLASFSAVEQLVGVNQRLDAVADGTGGDSTGLATWIGRLASAVDGRFRASAQPVEFAAAPLAGAERIETVIRAADGSVIDRFDLDASPGGRAVWEGPAANAIQTGTELRIELVYHGPKGVIERRPAAVFREIVALRGTEKGPVFDLADGSTLRPGEVAELRHPGG